jgi:hypothetical protein
VELGGGVREMATTCIVIPSLAVSMLPDDITMRFHRETWDNFVSTLRSCGKIISYIRHKPTTDLIESAVGKIDTGFEYKIEEGHLIFMVGLKFRAPVSGADVAVRPDDLLIYRVTIL